MNTTETEKARLAAEVRRDLDRRFPWIAAFVNPRMALGMTRAEALQALGRQLVQDRVAEIVKATQADREQTDRAVSCGSHSIARIKVEIEPHQRLHALQWKRY